MPYALLPSLLLQIQIVGYTPDLPTYTLWQWLCAMAGNAPSPCGSDFRPLRRRRTVRRRAVRLALFLSSVLSYRVQ